MFTNELLIFENDNVYFVNQRDKDFYNIGDDLCSPKHYFNFQSYNEKILIVGGGAFSDYGYQIPKKISTDISILWGIGCSRSLDIDSKLNFYQLIRKQVRNIKVHYRKLVARNRYTFISVRDLSEHDKSYTFVPCPSCFHPITEIPVGNQVGIIINASLKTHGDDIYKALEMLKNEYPTIHVAGNNMSVEEAMLFFSKVDRIITNSYHFAYWALLSGRKVKIIGYSSKFIELIKLFDLSDEFIKKYNKGESASLICHIRQSVINQMWIELPDSKEVRNKFRLCNINFMNHINRKDYLTISLKSEFASKDSK